MLCMNVHCLGGLSKAYHSIPVFLRCTVKLEQGWIWLALSPRLENSGSSGGNTVSPKFFWLGLRLISRWWLWAMTPRCQGWYFIWGDKLEFSTVCVCLKEVDNNLNGLSSGHFTICSTLLNLFSLVNLFALLHSHCWCLLLSHSKGLC